MCKKSNTARMWRWVNYSISNLNCGNCTHSMPDQWNGDAGKCSVYVGLIFDIIRSGVCRVHSHFGHGNLKIG